MKKINSVFIGLLLTCFCSCSCGGRPGAIEYEDLTPAVSNDSYRNMYQIFPISFADGTGDGRGDIKGIIAKLDYLKDMNYQGIWLNPIGPSKTYHHYDVEDYCAVAPVFGTMQDFDNLVTACHERNMTIILDLVLNHSSREHEWFQESYMCAKSGKTDKPQYKKYNWITCDPSSSAPSGYRKVNGGDKVAYEARFDATMPDFNLQQILDDGDGDLATEFKKIFKFWLDDHKVDGFRLDAVTSYFTNQTDKNLEMLTWINTECKKIKPNAYIVGEGDWGSNSPDNTMYQTSGIDSFFQFGNSSLNDGFITQAVKNQKATRIYDALVTNQEVANGGIEAPFLDNHDTARYPGNVTRTENTVKFTLGLLQQLKGATFTYYGDEIGMASQGKTSDGFYRLPMNWGDEYTCKYDVSGVSEKNINFEYSYPFDDVATQLANENSILNYAKKANLIRASFPEISHGSFEKVYSPSDDLVVIKRTYNNSSIYVVINANASESKTVDFSDYGEKVAAELCVDGYVKQMDKSVKTIEMPSRSIAVIK